MNKNVHINIGKKIKFLRESNGNTKQELAKVLGYSSDTAVHLIEQGKRKLAIDKLKIIAEYFEIPISELIEPDIDKKKVNVITALRSDDSLTQKDLSKISSFIDFIKSEAQKDEHDGR